MFISFLAQRTTPSELPEWGESGIFSTNLHRNWAHNYHYSHLLQPKLSQQQLQRAMQLCALQTAHWFLLHCWRCSVQHNRGQHRTKQHSKRERKSIEQNSSDGQQIKMLLMVCLCMLLFRALARFFDSIIHSCFPWPHHTSSQSSDQP